jgi:hypothetical protein
MPSDSLSTGDLTGSAALATSVGSSSAPSPVNPAQTAPAQQIVETSAIISQYEQRINRLMSEKDKAINERNQVIANLTDVQQQLTALQEQTQTSLTGAANAAQQAIDRAKMLEIQLADLQAESLRNKTLLEKPHLAPYAQFIPASADPEKVRAAVEQLEQIRQQDLERNQGLRGQNQAPIPPVSQGSAQQNPTLGTIYQNRPTMNPAFPSYPGSSPAMMNPLATAADPIVAIEALFAEAKQTGDPQAFEQAVKQAALLSQTAVNQQLGRSS